MTIFRCLCLSLSKNKASTQKNRPVLYINAQAACLYSPYSVKDTNFVFKLEKNS